MCDHSNEIRIERIKHIHAHRIQILSANLVIGTIIASILWNSYPATYVLPWLASIYVLTLFRWLWMNRYVGKDTTVTEPLRVEKLLFAASLTSGCIWGSAGILFVNPEHIMLSAIVVLALLGMTSGAVASLSVMPKVFLAFLVPVWLPLTIHFLLLGEAEFYALAGMCIFYLITVLGHSGNTYKLATQSLSLRYKNLDLIDELRLEKERAEEANLEKSRFLASASHDLRQPLHSLSLFLEALDHRLKQQDNRKLLEQAVSSVNSLDDLFNALLDISKLDAGIVEVSLRHFAIQPVIDRVLEDYKPLILKKGLQLSCVKSSAWVYSDEIAIERILRNLISNAAHHTHSGRILIGCRRLSKDGQISVTIIDTGTGIPDSEQSKVFSEFYQLNNPERDRSKGLGLGLAIVKRLVDLLDIKLELSSTIHKGSQFTIVLNEGKPTPEHNSPVEISRRDIPNCKILIIDDEKAILQGMATVIETWGGQAWTADELESATPIAQKIQPDLLLVDYRLRGGQNGINVISALSQQCGRNIPAILVTGDTAVKELIKAKASGLTVLHKPVHPVQLRLAITRVLRKSGVY